MALSFEPLEQPFAARVKGLDMREPVRREDAEALKRGMAQYPVCVIGHDTPPSDDQHIVFSGLMGPMERGSVAMLKGADQRVGRAEIVDQSNLDETGEIYRDNDRRLAYKRANRLWHTDMSFFDVRATYSLLAAHKVPPSGGETEFIDMRAVYDALPADRKAGLEGLTVEHSYWYSRVLGGGPEATAEEKAARPPARHPLVDLHKPSGRKTLYLASHAMGIVDWPENKARALIGELMAFATEPRFVFRHTWRNGDVLVWDNLCTMHRATPFDDRTFKRDVRRTTCREKAVGTIA